MFEDKFTGAVAMLDILGFSDMITKMKLEDIRDLVVKTLLDAVRETNFILQHDFERIKHFSDYKGDILPLEWIYFSDTIFFYLKSDDKSSFGLHDPVQRVDSMIYFCSLFFRKCILNNLPLRGAISYGECLVSKYPAYFLGLPIVEAYKLEKKQKWAGITLYQSAVKMLNKSEIRACLWDVPIEQEKQKLYVVNWPQSCYEEPNWDKCFNSAESDVIIKMKNTKDFFDSHANLPVISVSLDKK